MDEGTALTLFFLQIWRLFELESPFFGLKVWQIVLGLFVCELGVGVFSEFFVGLFNVAQPSVEQRMDDYNRRHSRINRYVYNRSKHN